VLNQYGFIRRARTIHIGTFTTVTILQSVVTTSHIFFQPLLTIAVAAVSLHNPHAVGSTGTGNVHTFTTVSDLQTQVAAREIFSSPLLVRVGMAGVLNQPCTTCLIRTGNINAFATAAGLQSRTSPCAAAWIKKCIQCSGGSAAIIESTKRVTLPATIGLRLPVKDTQAHIVIHGAHLADHIPYDGFCLGV